MRAPSLTLRLVALVGIAAAWAVPGHAAWQDVATISSTLGNNAYRVCVGGGGSDLGCPVGAPLLDIPGNRLTVPGDLRVVGNLLVSGSQSFDGVTFANGGVSATGTISATGFAGDGSGITGIDFSANPVDRIISGTAAVIAQQGGTVGLTLGGTANAAYFHPTLGFVGPGVSTTGIVSTSGIYIQPTGIGSYGQIFTNPAISANGLGIKNDGNITNVAAMANDLYLGTYRSNSVAQEDIVFFHQNATSTTTSMLLRGTDGFVGIGTTNPTARLEVNGTISATNLRLSGNLYVSGTQTIDGVSFANGGVSASGTVTATSFAGDGSALTGVTASSVNWANINNIPTQVQAVSNGTVISMAGISATNVSVTTNLTVGGAATVGSLGTGAINASSISVTTASVGDLTANSGRVNGDLTVTGNLNVSGSQTIDGVTFANGGVSSSGTISASGFSGDGSGLTGIDFSANPVDRIVSGTAAVIAQQAGTVGLTLGGVADAAYFHPTLGFVGPGVSTTGPISATQLYAGRFNSELGTEAMRIVSSTNIGIGTSSPLAKLHVYSGSSGISFGTFRPTAFFESGGTDGRYSVLQAKSNGAPGSFRVANDGKVGIQAANGTILATALDVSGTLRIANGGEACDASRTGAIRYSGADFQFCRNGTSWESLAAVADSSAPDRIVSGTTTLQVVSTTGYISLTQAGVNTGWFDPSRGLVTLGVSSTGGISGTTGYFAGNVGIGTTTASSNLEISATSASLLRLGNSTNYATFRNNGSAIDFNAPQGFIISANSNGFQVHTSNNPIFMNPNSTGRIAMGASGIAVGIGMGQAIASTTLHVSGTLRIANGGESCDANRTGAIRYAAGQFQVCRNGTTWENLVAGGTGTIETDRITSGTDAVVVNDATNTVSFTQNGVTTAYINNGQLVAGSISTTGAISGTSLYGNQLTATTASLTTVATGNVSTTGNISVTGNVSANQFIGDGSLLTNINAGNISGLNMDRITSGTSNVVVNTNGAISFTTAGTERMNIDANGYIGIGQQPIFSNALSISGTTQIRGRLDLTIPDSSSSGRILIGGDAAINNTGNGVVAVGYRSAYDNSGNQLTAFGDQSAASNQGNETIAVGYYAGYDNSGNNLIAIGSYTGVANTGSEAFMLGANAGAFNRGNQVVLAGSYAGQYNTASSLIAVGHAAAIHNQASGTIAIGREAMYDNKEGLANIGIGYQALMRNETGSYNTVLGYAAAVGIVSNSHSANTLIGAYTGTALTTGSNNTIVGANSGMTLTTGGGNILLGAGLTTPAATTSNYLSIGNAIFGDISSGLGYANRIGINVAAPTTALHVSGTLRIANGAEACDSNRTGAIRFTAGQFQVCRNGTSWETLVAGASGSVDTDRITSGTTAVVANTNGNTVSVTTGGTTTSYFHGTLGLVTPGVSATGTVSSADVNTGRVILRGVAGSAGVSLSNPGDNLGNHTATQNLDMGGFNITNVGNISTTGNISANQFIGDGSQLTNINASNITGLTTDSIVSGTTRVTANTNGNTVSITTAGTTTSYFHATMGLVTPGVSSTGPISGTNGYFNGELRATGDVYGYRYFGSEVWLDNDGYIHWSNDVYVVGNGISKELRFGTTNTDAMIITSNSYVGIGTLTPSTELEVSGTISATNILLNGQPLASALSSDRITSGTSQVFASQNTSVTIATDGTARVIVGTNGKVGINKNVPDSDLHVVASGFDGNTVTFEGNDNVLNLIGTRLDGTEHAAIRVFRRNNSMSIIEAGQPLASLQAFGSDGSIDQQGAAIYMTAESNFSSNRAPTFIDFTTRGPGDDYADTRMRITGSGLVGMGSYEVAINPSTSLHVGGTLRIADGGESCDADRTGAIRFTGGQFQVCRNGTSWETMVAGATGTADTDRITSGTTSVIARQNGAVTISATSLQLGNYDNSGEPDSLYIGLGTGNNQTSMTTVLGGNAGQNNTGLALTAIGRYSAANNTANNVTAIGSDSARSNTGISLVAVGQAAAQYNTGSRVVAVGAGALMSNNAIGSTAVGRLGLYNNTSGLANTSVGYQTLLNTETGSYNTAIGFSAGQGVSDNSFSANTLLGAYTGTALTTGSSNTIVGANSGMTLTTGANNILLGAGLTTPAATTSNYLSIGNAIFGDISSGLGYANRIGINVAVPTTALEVSGTVSATTAYTGLLSLKPVSASAGVSLSMSGDNLGNHTATQALNMATFNITGVGNISATGNISANKFIGDGSLLTNLSVSGDRITSGTLTVTANTSGNTVSLTTSGTTWGYLGSTASYIPSLTSNVVSSTQLSTPLLQLQGVSSTGGISLTTTADNLGNHTATQNLNMAGFNIINAGNLSSDRLISGTSNIVVNSATSTVSFTLGGVTVGYLHPTLGLISPGVSTTGTISGTTVATPILQLVGVSGSAGVSMTSGGGTDNLGNHTATQALAMGGFNITGVGNVSASGSIQPGNADTSCSSGADYGKMRFNPATSKMFMCRP